MGLRRWWRSGLIIAWLIVFTGTAAGQVQDRVTYRDPKTGKLVTREGNIMAESPGGITFVWGLDARKEFIPVTALEDIRFAAEPPETLQARAAEAKQQWQKALDFYQQALRGAGKAKMAVPFIEFKILKLRSLLMEQQETDPLQRADLYRQLEQFHKRYPNAWQTVECLELMGQLRLRDGLPVDEVLAELRAVRDKYQNQAELVGRVNLFEARALVQQAQGYLQNQPDKALEIYKQARASLEKLMQTTTDRNLRQEILVSLVECKAALRQHKEAEADLALLEKEAQDPRTKALVHLARGDIYRLSERIRDAMWEYLWVDVVYNQDRDLVARALYWLVDVFRKLGDEEKAKACQERLLNEFRDTVWAKRLGK
ncbi:MAG: tetratricopeptide repeat protein [Gemmatales bacterium]|nr:tetratricopeptide repeat protein [Gemmatales bacterium]MDW7995300.1 tetratricopeptide repeat protein [Gemmatales bacterium]